MHGASVSHEIDAGPGMCGEEFGGKLIAFQAITAIACENDVAMTMCAAMCQRVDVVERRGLEIERCAAVHTTAAAVAHGGALDCALESGSAELADTGAPDATRETGEHDVVTVSTNGHFTSREKPTPRHGKNSRSGVSMRGERSPAISATVRARRCRLARRLPRLDNLRFRTSVRASGGEKVAFAV